MRIYTRSGDEGETGLFGGQRVPKSDPRVVAYGDVDELNAFLGWANSLAEDPELHEILRPIQSDLFTVGADLATPTETSAATNARLARVDEEDAKRLERQIDQLDERLQPLRTFILPGGSGETAALQICRTVCRRAERSVVRLSKEEDVNPWTLVYLNRLSDLLFVLSRWKNQDAGIEEQKWIPKTREPESD